VARRQVAAAAVETATFPTADEEVWRYSRIDELDLDAYSPIVGPAVDPSVPAGAQAVLDQLPDRSGAVVLRNGSIVACELDPALAARGVRLGAIDEIDGGEQLLGTVGEPHDLFAVLNDAFAPQPVLLHVPRGVTVERPVVVIDWIDQDGGASFSRLVVRAEENCEVTVLDWHGSDDVVALAAPVIELDADRAARLRYVNVQDRGPRVWQIASQVSRGGVDATVSATQAALGGDYARTRADCKLVGRGAHGNLAAIYFGETQQMLDFRTFQDHAAPDTTSNLLFKGAVGDSSRSVYTGLIKVRKDARGTNAFQTNRNLKLSEHAWAESVPNLEIENNDVRCSHASTVGPVDEDQRFYLESRGVPTAVAERLIVAGFFEEVLEELAVPAVVPLIKAKIEERLDRRVREAPAHEVAS
jgi:Fe-S cluster assembly protein SufD